MADAVYKQALDVIISQLPSIGSGLGDLFADAAVYSKARILDWEDVADLGGLTVRFNEDHIRENPEGTNERDIYGYPCYIVHAQGHERELADDIHKIVQFFRDIRRYYHNKRRMSSVSDTGVNQEPCMVTNGPLPSYAFMRQRDVRIRSLTVWAWFLEPRTA